MTIAALMLRGLLTDSGIVSTSATSYKSEDFGFSYPLHWPTARRKWSPRRDGGTDWVHDDARRQTRGWWRKSDDARRRKLGRAMIHAEHTAPTPTLTSSERYPSTLQNPSHGASCGGDYPISTQLALPGIVTRHAPLAVHLRPRSDTHSLSTPASSAATAKKAIAASIS